MLQACTTSTAGNILTTGIQPLKDLLGMTTATCEDTTLTLALEAASRQIEQWLGQPVSLGTYRETVTGNDDLELMLTRTPIRSILGVFDGTSTADATVLSASEYVLEDADVGLLYRVRGWVWTPALTAHLTIAKTRTEHKDWLIEYTAGYRIVESTTTDGGLTTTGRDVPADIAYATLLQAKGLYSGRRRDGSLKRLQVGPTEREWQLPKDRSSLLFPDAEAIISHRRRMAIA